MKRHRIRHANNLPIRPLPEDKGVSKDYIDLKFFGFRFKGAVRSCLVISASGIVIGALGFAGYRLIKLYFDLKMIDANTTAEILKIMARRVPLNTKSQETLQEIHSTDDVSGSNDTEVRDWLENFEVEFPRNFIQLPPIIDEYAANCPVGFEVPVIAALTAELAGCFSNVRAKYLDDKPHRANVMVVIEAPFSSLKGLIKRMIDTLFGRRIQRDIAKVSENSGSRKIIQTLAPNVSESTMLDILGNNQGIHTILMDPETTTMVNAVRNKNNGLTYETIRKAYDNDELTRMNGRKNAPQGSFTTAINIVLTGTPEATGKFLGAEIEGGTASRMCLCMLPKLGKEIPSFPMPDGELLTQFQVQLDAWTEKYAYTTDADGNDNPVAPYETDMNYVNRALQEWLDDQYDLSQSENNPARDALRLRIASSAFNCAIVWHMLYGEPSSRQRSERKSVVDLTIYMANYFMERWLHKFGAKHNEQQAKFTAEELVKIRRTTNASKHEDCNCEIPSDPMEKGKFFESLKDAGMTDAELKAKYGLTRNQINGFIHRYRKKLKITQQDS